MGISFDEISVKDPCLLGLPEIVTDDSSTKHERTSVASCCPL